MPRRHCTTDDPRCHRRSWLGTAPARDIRAEVQGSCHPHPVAYGDHPVVAFVAPRCRCSPRGSGVHARPARAYARVGSIPENKYPTGHRDQRKREPSPTFGKNYLTKKDSPFSTLHRTPHIPSAPMSYALTCLPSPEPLLPAAPAVPVTEETDLHVQQCYDHGSGLPRTIFFFI